MRNLRTIKRAKALCLTFLLILLTGTAFAFAAGNLDILSNIHIAPSSNYLAWTNVVAGDGFQLITPAGAEFGATHTAQIAQARGRTRQRIYWDVRFEEAGFASITATATNESSLHSIYISDVSHRWEGMQPGLTESDFGFLVDIQDDFFTGAVLLPLASASVIIEVEWTGIYDEDFIFNEDEVFTRVGTLVIEFDYELD